MTHAMTRGVWGNWIGPDRGYGTLPDIPSSVNCSDLMAEKQAKAVVLIVIHRTEWGSKTRRQMFTCLVTTQNEQPASSN